MFQFQRKCLLKVSGKDKDKASTLLKIQYFFQVLSKHPFKLNHKSSKHKQKKYVSIRTT